MGLKMPSDEETLATKIFLNRANVKSKAKSWLSASSTGPATESTSSLDTKTSRSTTVDKNDDDDDITNIINASNELSGIGVTSKTGEDDISNRQLAGANDALRRKLLSKDAYKRFNQGRLKGVDVDRSTKVRKADPAEDYDEVEEKGKSVRQELSVPTAAETSSDGHVNAVTPAGPKPSSKPRKRPSSYLDQLLEDRKNKQQKKAKKSADDD